MSWQTVPQHRTCSSKASISIAAAGRSDDTCPWVGRAQLTTTFVGDQLTVVWEMSTQSMLQMGHGTVCLNYGFFAPLPVRPLACSPVAFAPWLIHPLACSPLCLADSPPWLVRLLTCSPPGWFPPVEYTDDSLLRLVSIYRKATNKCSVTSLINSYFN